MLRISNKSDSFELAKIHKNSYSANHFTASMPISLLQIYYEMFYTTKVSIIVSSKENKNGLEDIDGFAVFGSGIPEIISRFEREYRLAIIRAGMNNPVLFFKKAALRVLAILSPKTHHTPSDFLLLSIAVNDKGKGIGKSLLNEMINMAHDIDVNVIGLYVNIDNIKAINAYLVSGFKIKEELRNQYYMELSLDNKIGNNDFKSI